MFQDFSAGVFFAQGLSAPGQDHEFTRLCVRVCPCMGMCRAALCLSRPGSAVAL